MNLDMQQEYMNTARDVGTKLSGSPNYRWMATNREEFFQQSRCIYNNHGYSKPPIQESENHQTECPGSVLARPLTAKKTGWCLGSRVGSVKGTVHRVDSRAVTQQRSQRVTSQHCHQLHFSSHSFHFCFHCSNMYQSLNANFKNVKKIIKVKCILGLKCIFNDILPLSSPSECYDILSSRT